MVVTTSIAVNGTVQRLLGGNPSRVALLFFLPFAADCFVGPQDSLTINGAMFRVHSQVTKLIKLRQFGTILGGEWWFNGPSVGLINCIEVY